MDLRSNQLSGAVPLKFSELIAVEEIQLVDNNLIGSVPIEMCALNFTIFSVDQLRPVFLMYLERI